MHVYWRIDFDRLRRLPSSLTSAIVVPLINSNWALISARMDVLIVNVVAVKGEHNETPTTAIKLESYAKLGFKNYNFVIPAIRWLYDIHMTAC